MTLFHYQLLLVFCVSLAVSDEQQQEKNKNQVFCRSAVCGLDEHCEEDAFGPSCTTCLDCVLRGDEASCGRSDCTGCTSHQDCREGEYCNNGTEAISFCQGCDKCGNEGWFSAVGDCPQHCLCRTSDDCPFGYFCTTHGHVDEYPEGHGLCQNCAEESWGCVQDWLVSPDETCQAMCPTQFECNTHEDCGSNGQWCDKRHKCQECGPQCSKINPSGIQLNEKSRFVYRHLPYDGGICPNTCCDWGMARENFNSVYDTGIGFAVVHPCNSSLDIDIYTRKGRHDGITPEALMETGEVCKKTSFHNNSYFFFSCSVVQHCERHVQTIGMVATNTLSGAIVYANTSAYPFSEEFSFRTDSCGTVEGVRFAVIIAGVCVFLVVLCTCLCVSFLCLSCTRRVIAAKSPLQDPYV